MIDEQLALLLRLQRLLEEMADPNDESWTGLNEGWNYWTTIAVEHRVVRFCLTPATAALLYKTLEQAIQDYKNDYEY